jgi:hypothetical protein
MKAKGLEISPSKIGESGFTKGAKKSLGMK